MPRKSPYSYARGVTNVKTQQVEDATLADLRERFRKPVVLSATSKDYTQQSKKQRNATKQALPYFVGGTLAGGKRHDDNVSARTLLTLDIEANPKKNDSQPPQPQDVFDKLEGLGAEGWVYTSLSHTPDAPRYRVVLPLNEWMQEDDLTTDVLKSSTQAAAKKLDLLPWCTPESWVLSQPMYLPARLKDGPFWEGYTGEGKGWRIVAKQAEEKKELADIPDGPTDPVLVALKRAGLYLQEDPKHKGKHYITCPFVDQHGTENDTQTVYYEAHHDGNPRPAVKCFDTDPDEDGQPHLTYRILVNWLREHGHLPKSEENADTATALEDYESFLDKASIAEYLKDTPEEREFAWEKFAPCGKVTVLAGPGGVSKSMLMLHLLVYGALGQGWAGFQVNGPLRGLYASYEDDRLELHRRVHGLAQGLKENDDGLGDMLYDIDGTLQRNLLLYAADEEATSWILMRKDDQRSAAERTARVEWLVGLIKHARLKALVLDPVVYTHNLEENNTGDMAAYMQTLTYIAKSTNCAVVVLHHMHKTAQWATLDEINQGSLRGASSFADNSRSVGVLISMPQKDAPRFNVPQADVAKYAVFKHVKHNYSAPMAPVVFERKGPLLVPRPDIEPMTGEQAADAQAEAKARARQGLVEGKCKTLIGWLLEQEPAKASFSMLRAGTGIRFTMIKEVVQYAVESGWLEQEPGPNRSQWYFVTKEGKKWVKQ
jgi:RecA-family ATPase